MGQGGVRSVSHGAATACATAAAILLLALLAPAAIARNLYVTNFEAAAVSVFDTATNQAVGPPIAVGKEPFGIAITPDGTRAYVANAGSEDVSVIDTHTNQVVGAPITVGKTPLLVAIAPDGTRAYVSNFGSESVSVIETATNQAVGPPIAVGKEPFGIAITPDGSRAYVVNFADDTVSVIDLATNLVLTTLEVGVNPWGIAITPDGSRAYVANATSGSVSTIEIPSDKVMPALTGIKGAEYLALTPDAGRLYVSGEHVITGSVIDARAGQVTGMFEAGKEPLALTATPDGSRVYLSHSGSGVSAIDTKTNQVLSPSLDESKGTGGLAIVPDQPPVAAFSVQRARPGVPVRFRGSASQDRDGKVATYAWAFGDRGTASLKASHASHTYRAVGDYRATLTLTDNEGCSTSPIFTGQTAYCNGAPVAETTKVIRVRFPAVRVGCPRSAGSGGCRFKLLAIAKRKRTAESAVARAHVGAGESAILSLRPRRRFRVKLGRARRVLVRETVRIGGSRDARVRSLKIVR